MSSRRFGQACRWCGIVLAALAFSAHAEVLRDPTRPPAELGKAAPGDAGDVEASPRLQSILISPKRRIAVVSGQMLMVGDDFRGAQVVRISENEVVLRSGNSTQTLRLFAGIEKKRAHGETLAAKAGAKDKTRDR